MSAFAHRLTACITTLMERYKLQPDGPYAGLGFSETAIISRISGSESPPVQGSVAQSLGLPKTTMASAVRRLEDRGLLMREPSAEDGRMRRLMLTQSGHELAGRLHDARLSASEAMLASLSPDDRRTLVELLERIANARDRIDGDDMLDHLVR